MLERWRRVLSRHSGSGRLWRAFLAWRRGGGGGAAAAINALRHDYADALAVVGPAVALDHMPHVCAFCT